MTSFLADLLKDVQCSSCNNTLQEPKLLPCFHTFCKLCIKRNADRNEEVNVFECPVCKTKTSLPELNSVEDLKPSLLHSRMLKVVHMMKTKRICTGMSRSRSCHCGTQLCDKFLKTHTIVIKDQIEKSLSEVNQEDMELLLRKEDYCKGHPGKYCEKISTLNCTHCREISHRDNLLANKEDQISKSRSLLEELKLNQKEKEEQTKNANIIQQTGESAKKEVMEKTREMINLLEKNELQLLRQINDKMEIAKRNLNIIHHLDAVMKYTKDGMERGLASEMIDAEEPQFHEDLIFESIPQDSRILFVPNEVLVSTIGKIQYSFKTNHEMSNIQVEGTPQATMNAELILTTRNLIGELNKHPDDQVEVEFFPKNDAIIRKTHKKIEGKIKFEFIPKVPGTLTAKVKVDGNPLSRSLEINVKPQEMEITREFMTIVEECTGIAVNKTESKIAISIWSSHCIRIFNNDGNLLLNYGSRGSEEGQFSSPEGLAFLNEKDLLVADCLNHRICIVDTETGALLKTFGNRGQGDGQFYYLNGVRVDDDGNIIVCDHDNHRVQVFTKDGDYKYQFGLPEQDRSFSPMSAVTYGERFYVSDEKNHVIQVFEKKDGIPSKLSTIGGHGSDNGQLKQPWGLAIDNDNNLLVCDYSNNRIQKFTLDGRFVGTTIKGNIKNPLYIECLKNGELLTSTTNGRVLFIG